MCDLSNVRCILKTGTHTGTVFNSNTCNSERIGYDVLFERKIEDVISGLERYYQIFMNPENYYGIERGTIGHAKFLSK
jgi:hypothetical protein